MLMWKFVFSLNENCLIENVLNETTLSKKTQNEVNKLEKLKRKEIMKKFRNLYSQFCVNRKHILAVFLFIDECNYILLNFYITTRNKAVFFYRSIFDFLPQHGLLFQPHD